MGPLDIRRSADLEAVEPSEVLIWEMHATLGLP